MAEFVGVRFKEVGKVYYFDPDGHTLKKGDKVIVVGGTISGKIGSTNSIRLETI